MGLKLLHTADWHLGSLFRGFSPEDRQALRAELARLPRLLGDILRREGCQLALLSGDLFDSPPDRDTVEALKAELKNWDVPVFIAPGNHDPAAPGFPWEESWPENVVIFRSGPESVLLPKLDVRIWGGGFRGPEAPSMLDRFRGEGPERYQIGLFHGDPLDARSSYNPVTGSQVEESGLSYLALGHIHAGGYIRRGRTLCAWPGCPMGRGWDETGEKGVWLVELEEKAELTFCPVPGIRFREQTLDIRGNAGRALREALPGGGSRDFFRITLEGEGDLDPASLIRELPEYPRLTILDHTCPATDLWEGVGEDTLEGLLLTLLQQKDQDGDPRAAEAARICRRILENREVAL